MTLLILAGGCTEDRQPQPVNRPNPLQPSMLNRAELDRVISSQPAQTPEINGRMVSGVIPHHLLAAPLLTRYLSAMAIQQPEVIILIGPNHDNEGARIITGGNDWQTPEGNMYAEQPAVKALLDSGMAVRDDKVLATEHSIAGLVPLLHHYMPSARIIPITLHHGVSLNEIDNLIDVLSQAVPEKTIMLASVDFSHYLSRPQAQEKDRFTLHKMQELDYFTLFKLGNDYLDSPASLAAAFRWAEKYGIRNFQVLDNTNSGILLANDTIETTSYFTLVFSQ